ncbi:MAG: kelch repeat-containing protein [Candidatus Acidiferrum sp.]
MANGNFQSGNWVQLPTNCTQELVLTYTRCAEYGTEALMECVIHVTQLVSTCVQGVWNYTKKCSWWSWLFCVLFAIVATFTCMAFALVAVTFCALFALVEVTICLLWTLVSITLCLSKAQGGTAFLLTDGTVMMQEFKSINAYYLGVPLLTWPTRRWWKLTPDNMGSYQNGSWSRLADSNLGRAGFASAVLADGRVVVCGGEYSDSSGANAPDDDNTCEIYDPMANTWTMIASPTTPGSPGTTWMSIGDAPCTLLPTGELLMGSILDNNVAKLDPVALTWTAMNMRPGVPSSSEDSWVLMADNTITAPSCTGAPKTWVYDILNDKWNKGDKPVKVVNFAPETGPALLRYDGTAFFLGANEHTAIYSAAASPQWSDGPDLPEQDGAKLAIEDGPAVMLVNGNVLFGAGVGDDSGSSSAPCWYFEYDGTTFYKTNDPPNYVAQTFVSRLLLLPNGDVLFCRQDDSSFYAYHSDAAVPEDSFRPVIQTCPSAFLPGDTIQVSGLQFNGLSQAVAYGDDSQTATNYPLVRIVNKQTNHVKYCRTSGHTTVVNGNTVPAMGVATGTVVVTTNVAIPIGIEGGASSLFVVANGIASEPFDVMVSLPSMPT